MKRCLILIGPQMEEVQKLKIIRDHLVETLKVLNVRLDSLHTELNYKNVVESCTNDVFTQPEPKSKPSPAPKVKPKRVEPSEAKDPPPKKKSRPKPKPKPAPSRIEYSQQLQQDVLGPRQVTQQDMLDFAFN